MKRINITFNEKGEGKMHCIGLSVFRCIGRKGLKYPKDLTLNPLKPGVKANPKISGEFVCEYDGVIAPCVMNYAILIWGQLGIYIHEWPGPATYEGNGGSTAGCIHLEIGDAKTVYDWIDDKTRITMSYPW